ncbi:MAG: hypothetical protein M3Q65_16750 [Chloroflexota bacterium]|nr:hypothetical protein [Chloroflexota bacterium]
MSIERAKRDADQRSGVSNVAYDLVTLLQNKLKGIAAMEMYRTDAEQAGDREVLDLLARLEQRERQDVEQLKALVVPRLQ